MAVNMQLGNDASNQIRLLLIIVEVIMYQYLLGLVSMSKESANDLKDWPTLTNSLLKAANEIIQNNMDISVTNGHCTKT